MDNILPQNYQPLEERYEQMEYRRLGRSGLKLPLLSLGLWHNFGSASQLDHSRLMVRKAFDLGITHFDLANNYGPPPGSAEVTFGELLRLDLKPFRDELIISTKAGYVMWPGPYGNWGSRKSLLASLDQSLRRMGLDYVDIFYSHRPDPETPIEETVAALDQAVRSGKALYAGISNYSPAQTRAAAAEFRRLGTPCVIHQFKYSMFVRTPEEGLLDLLGEEGMGGIAFSPMAQGLLTNRYLDGIPADARAATKSPFLTEEQVTEQRVEKARKLNHLARERGQSLAQMALSWVLRNKHVSSALIGASRPSQIEENAASIHASPLTMEELQLIDAILGE